MTIDFNTLIKTEQKDGIYTQFVSKDKLFVNWYTAQLKIEVIERYFKQAVGDQIIRVYDVTKRLENNNESRYLEIRIPKQHNYWTIKGLKEDKVYFIELGVIVDNHYFPLHRSSIIPLEQAANEEQKSNEMGVTNSRRWNGNVSTYSFYENVEGSE